VLDQQIASYIDANRDRFLNELRELLAIPSVSALPEHAGDVERAAEWLATHLRDRIGMQVELIPTAQHPLVYGERLQAPGKPTVLLYGHFDVQPVDPLDEWRTPPWEATLVGNNLYARGAVDDKGPTLAAIKAFESLLTLGELPVNLKVLLEGAEEMGSAPVTEWVGRNAERLACDAVLILDTDMEAPGVPTLTYALRGMVYLELTARGAPTDLHSGMYGGVAPNPIQALIWVLSDLKGRDWHINVPGLYETMQPLTESERELFRQQEPTFVETLRAGSGLDELVGEAGVSAVERATARPTFEVHGIRGGFTGAGGKTVIPAVATAKVSLRLVAGQNPAAVFEAVKQRVAELAPPGITIEVTDLHSAPAVVVPTDSPVLRAAAAAMEDQLGRKTAFIRTGGTIGVAAAFHEVLRAPLVMMGFGLSDDNVHAPNEKMYLPNFYVAIRSVAGFLQNLGNA